MTTATFPRRSGSALISAEATTPARVREIHRDLLARLQEERGDRFWMLDTA